MWPEVCDLCLLLVSVVGVVSASTSSHTALDLCPSPTSLSSSVNLNTPWLSSSSLFYTTCFISFILSDSVDSVSTGVFVFRLGTPFLLPPRLLTELSQTSLCSECVFIRHWFLSWRCVESHNPLSQGCMLNRRNTSVKGLNTIH